LWLKIRDDLEIQRVNYKGNQALLVSDRIGLIENPLVLRGEALEILALIDGRRTAENIQLEFIRQKGYSLAGAALVTQILGEFKRLFLLDTPEFRQKKQELLREFSELAERPAALAGEAYPEEKDELSELVKQMVELEPLSDEPGKEISSVDRKKLKALVAPHIDLRAGRRVYCRAYRMLKDCSFDRVVVLGTGHSVDEGIFSLTEKDFRLPSGTVTTDKKAVRKLKAAGGELVASHDFAHRKEHSIEFQLIFLQSLLGHGFELVPILCGSFHHWLKKVNRASEIPGIGAFLEELKSLSSDQQKHTLVVAGVDFSHVGPKFGHRESASELKEAMVFFDNKIIEALVRLDPLSFWKLHQEREDSFNVCGFSTLAVLLEMLQRGKGYLLGYDLMMDEATQSAVSFAAIAFI
jgi:hypothetical protein